MAFRRIRTFINRHKVLTLAVALAILGALAAFSFRDRIRGLSKPPEKVVPEHERFPVYGESDSYHTLHVVHPRGKSQIRFEVPAEEGTAVEVGLVRTDDTSSYWDGYSGKFRFRVFREKWLRNETLFETDRTFAVNEHASFRVDIGRTDPKDSLQEIFVEVKKASQDMAKGYEAYRDFAYFVPNVCNKRGPDEFNVILVSFDTLRADHLGCYGYERDTSPNIDAFAKEGIIFSQAISPSPWTAPAHFSLFTALYPSAHQNNSDVNDYHFFLSQQTLARLLKENGFYTVGLTHGGYVSAEFGFGNGFNIYKEYLSILNTRDADLPWTYENDTEKVFDEAMRWLDEHAETKFFMFLHSFECHIPYQHSFFVTEEVTKSLIEHRKALYDGDIRYADSFFGEFMQKLRSLDLMSNTIIVFLSDHGDEFYEHYRESDIIPAYTKPIIPQLSDVDHAHSLYEELIHVPLIFHIPGLEPPKKLIENQVRLIDVMPTILDLLSVDYVDPIQGTSLLKLMRTGRRDKDPPAISEFTKVGPERKSIRKDGYKYIWIEDPYEIEQFALQHQPQHEMFDLSSDPEEKKDLYDQNAELGKEYHEALEEQLEASHAINTFLRRNYEPAGQGEKQLDEDLISNLKALGYIE